MREALVVLNTGSSSLKFSLFTITKEQFFPVPILQGKIDSIDDDPHFLVKDSENKIIDEKKNLYAITNSNYQSLALSYVLNWINNHNNNYTIVAAGHRVVHGGIKFTAPCIVDSNIIKQLEALNSLAPLHQPYNIAGIRAIAELLPTLLQVACFDTAFHITQPALAQAFAIPATLSNQPIKRYGFHGLSYEYINEVIPQHMGEKKAQGKIIIAHLGHGASMCAIQNRKSIATTMGFTALDGLPMGTRCGNLDPGVILYLLQQEKLSAAEVATLLYEKSGLLGVSGISSDVRVLLNDKSSQANTAIELFVYRIIRELGSLIAALSGLDGLVFTAGIGENVPIIRAKVCQQLKWLGIELDNQANCANQNLLSTPHSRVEVWVIPTNEELMIAKQTWNLWRRQV